MLDGLPISGFQIALLVMTGMAVVFDGIDNQIIGLAAPSLISEWRISTNALGLIFGAGFAGMVLGTLIGGWIGDRFGRRSALLAGIIAFGAATFATGFTQSVTEIAVLRMIAGLGLGGVPGTAAALIAEYMPSKYRPAAVSFGIICVAIGGIIGGFAASVILPSLGWRWFFYIGGALPLCATVLFYWGLPESPSFLLSRPHRRSELLRILERVGHPDPQGAISRIPPETHVYAPIADLFSPNIRRDTLALCAALFFGLFLIYSMFNWAPTLLFSNGFALPQTHAGLTAFNIGGVIGSIATGFAMTRFGSRPVLALLGSMAALICIGLALSPLSPDYAKPLLFALFVFGLTGSSVQSTIYAVASNAFPTRLRARGIGLMAGAGRLGAVFSAIGGATLVDHGGSAFFGALAVVLILEAIFLACVRNHIRAAHLRPAP
ncbi:MFS transporter [Sphingobium yanoikuyae]|uniref:MFS transporter n=2 Tax=Sphingobium yanoikuyae TaxID=13690 RepID=A0A9X7YFJ1_SPHYA|nr:MFS transporter [Sphingobium yanoikuyae]